MSPEAIDQRRREILAIATEILDPWPLKDAQTQLLVCSIRDTPNYWVGLFKKFDEFDVRPRQGMDLQIEADRAYLLRIHLFDQHYGLGHGHALYLAAIEIARRCGCKIIIQTPSGRTPNNREHRRDYLARRGWKAFEQGFEMYYELEDGYAQKIAAEIRQERTRNTTSKNIGAGPPQPDRSADSYPWFGAGPRVLSGPRLPGARGLQVLRKPAPAGEGHVGSGGDRF